MKIRDNFQIVGLAVLLATFNPLSYVHAQTGKSTIDRLVEIFVAWNGSPTDTQSFVEAAKLIDYRGMAERSIKPDEWKKLTAAQKEQFTDTLKTLIEQRYYTRWHKIFSKGKPIYMGETASAGDLFVKTKLMVGKKTDNLQWQLDSVNGERKVVSLAVEESDLLKKLSTRLQGKYDKAGFNGLLAWMNDKADLDGPSDSAQASSGAQR